jgi:hypothetical protein
LIPEQLWHTLQKRLMILLLMRWVSIFSYQIYVWCIFLSNHDIVFAWLNFLSNINNKIIISLLQIIAAMPQSVHTVLSGGNQCFLTTNRLGWTVHTSFIFLDFLFPIMLFFSNSFLITMFSINDFFPQVSLNFVGGASLDLRPEDYLIQPIMSIQSSIFILLYTICYLTNSYDEPMHVTGWWISVVYWISKDQRSRGDNFRRYINLKIRI